MGIFNQTPTRNTGEGGTWEVPEADNHVGALVAMIDLGTHGEAFQGGDARDTHKIFLVWELTEAPMSGTTGNHVIGQKYTLSLNEKAGLYKMLKAAGVPLVDGQPYPLETLLGKPCMVTVNHKQNRDGTRTYAEFGGMTGVPKALKGKAAGPKHTPFAFEIPATRREAEDAVKALGMKAWLPRCYGEPVVDIIRKSKEWLALPGQPAGRRDEITEDGEDMSGQGAEAEAEEMASADPIPF